jgi:hypothetical protein
MLINSLVLTQVIIKHWSISKLYIESIFKMCCAIGISTKILGFKT